MAYITTWSAQEPYVTTRSVSISPQYDTLGEAIEAALTKMVRVSQNRRDLQRLHLSLARSDLSRHKEYTLYGGDWGNAVFRIFEMPDSDIVDDWVQVYL